MLQTTGGSFSFGAELEPTGDQVWFRTEQESIGQVLTNMYLSAFIDGRTDHGRFRDEDVDTGMTTWMQKA